MPQSLVFAFVMTHMFCIVSWCQRKCVHCEKVLNFSWKLVGAKWLFAVLWERANLVFEKVSELSQSNKDNICWACIFPYHTQTSAFTHSLILINALQGRCPWWSPCYRSGNGGSVISKSLAPYHAVKAWQKRDLKLRPLGTKSPSGLLIKLRR